jgi:hypothetical protein
MIKLVIDDWRRMFDDEPLFTLFMTYVGALFVAVLFILVVGVPAFIVFGGEQQQCQTQGELK